MENGMNYGTDYGSDYYSYGEQTVFDPEAPLYTTLDPLPEVPEPTELPPEPEDSPYDDPVVRHILSVPDDDYRNRVLSYLNETVHPRRTFHPALVMAAILLCFPVGLCMMYFGTRWGTFAKVVVTIFVLIAALAVYEILVLGGILSTPSLIGTVAFIISELTGSAAA